MNGQQPYVSVVEPLTPAIERVKTVLFRPFDLRKWFVIGFCAWLAELGKYEGGSGPGGGDHGGVDFRWSGEGILEDIDRTINEALATVREYVEANLSWIIPVAILVLIIIVGLWLLLTWLNSRGRFMFLHCVAEDKGEVVVPWNKFSRHGDSLFAFRVVLGFMMFVIVVVGLVAGYSSLMRAVNRADGIGVVLTLAAVIAGIFVVSIPVLIVKKFTTDFVVPIMFVQTLSCRRAWGQFLPVLLENKMRFFLYLLFQIVIWFVVACILVAFACVTCGCACCFFAIPYIGTVVLLPILVFQRSYSLYYLRQYGLAFDVFRAERQATPV
ncbi:MAG: hypothetical protein JSW59_10700 [Phycisphaerales bacterium]|nr:MAG: hypothetical protein JSW59_10700 [Phycisphaerales bacterium]